MRMRAILVRVVALTLSLGLAGCGASSGSPTPTATAAAAAKTIGGQISYAGSAASGHKIVVVAGLAGSQGAPAYSAVIDGPGPYTLTDLADGQYTVTAFIDLGDDMGAPQANEPAGSYDVGGDGTADPVTIAGGKAATGIDITIKDR